MFRTIRQAICRRMRWPMGGVFYGDPSAVVRDPLRSHARFVMRGDVTLATPLEEVTLPAGRHADLYGPQADLPADSSAFVVYLNSPLGTTPEALVTETRMPR